MTQNRNSGFLKKMDVKNRYSGSYPVDQLITTMGFSQSLFWRSFLKVLAR